jgi:hypothetical protein
MALNDIVPFDDGTYMPGAKRYIVKGSNGRSNAINAGELVRKQALGAYFATSWSPGLAALATRPAVGTDYIYGLATSTSTETTSLDGTVDVMPITTGLTFLISPLVAASWDTQAKYDALVGARVLINYAATTGKMTVIASDSAANGLVVEPLDITKHPGKVRVSVRRALMYNS